MVVIRVKHSGDGDDTHKEFLYECESSAKIDEIVGDLSVIANLQLRIQCIAPQLQLRLSSLLHSHPNLLSFLRALSDAVSYVSKDQVLHNKALSKYVLDDHVRNIEREFMSNYDAMGYPNSNLQELMTDLELFPQDKIQLWLAKKELMKGKRLYDYIGKNEKTKMDLSRIKQSEVFRMKYLI